MDGKSFISRSFSGFSVSFRMFRILSPGGLRLILSVQGAQDLFMQEMVGGEPLSGK